MQYVMYENELEIIEKINQLENMVKDELKRDFDLFMEDLYILSAVDKSLKLIDSFLFAMEQRNITVLAALTRMQMDCVLRTYASTLVEDSGDFCKRVLCDNVRIDKEKSVSGINLSDKNLCLELEKVLKLPIYDLYQKVCGYVHFSSSSFHNSVKLSGNSGFIMKIGKNNIERDADTYKRLSIELANHFYYFGRVLIKYILHSWLKQKEQESGE